MLNQDIPKKLVRDYKPSKTIWKTNKMTRLEKCEYFKSKGYTYDPETGKVFGIYGKVINRKDNEGYIILKNHLKAHHYGWYMTYGNVDFQMLDHINRDKNDNRISNLRIINHQKNSFNTKAKGYTWDKKIQKWKSQIMINGKNIYIGKYDNEKEARQAYLIAKEKYHIIN